MVGSSSSSRSGSANSTAASATRMRQPPENSEQGRCWSAMAKPSPAGSRRRGPAPSARRYRRAASGSRRCGAGRARFRLRPAAAVRSRCGRSTTSIRLSGPSGASCARRPMRLRGGQLNSAVLGGISPVMTRNSVVLPVPLRPTRPTRAPAECARRRLPAGDGRQRGQ